MKKTSPIRAFFEKTSQNKRNTDAERVRTRALRLENLESRELLSVAPGGEFLAVDALVAYESSYATSADVLDISGAMLDGFDVQGAAPGQGTNSTFVTSDADVVDPDDGVVTLREALADAKPGSTITFANSLQGGTISLDPSLGQLMIRKSLTIDASNLLDPTTSAPGLTISGQGASRILYANYGINVGIVGITFANGHASGPGGAILNNGATLYLDSCAICDGEATNGGGIYSSGGRTTLVNCSITNNAAADGGGAYFNNGAATLGNCSITNNTASGSGGALYVGGANLAANQCLVAGNYAQYGTGLELYGGSASLRSCAITGNTAVDDGAGADLDEDSSLVAYNTIIAGNIAGNTASTGPEINIYDSESAARGYNTLSSFTNWADGANNYVYDASKPLFADAASGDYTLADDSISSIPSRFSSPLRPFTPPPLRRRLPSHGTPSPAPSRTTSPISSRAIRLGRTSKLARF